MTVVKEVTITKDYLGLDKDFLECKNKETYEKCTTRLYIEAIKEQCNCVPYRLKFYSEENQVKEEEALN